MFATRTVLLRMRRALLFPMPPQPMRSALEFVADVEEPGHIQLEVRDGAGVLVLKASVQELAAACDSQSTYLGSGA
jgi:hypothetical protein